MIKKSVILLVTWLVPGQQPTTTQTSFSSMRKCEEGRAAVLEQAERIGEKPHDPFSPPPPPDPNKPTVTAVCMEK